MFAVDLQFLLIGEKWTTGNIGMAQDRLEFLLVGLQFREALFCQGQFIITRDGIAIGIAEEEIRKLIQNSIFQFGGRKTRSGKCGDECHWYRGWRRTFRRWRTRRLCDNRAHFSSDYDWGGDSPDRGSWCT